MDLCEYELFIITGEDLKEKVVATPRINIHYAEEYKNNRGGFWLREMSLLVVFIGPENL